jgi:phage protein U
MFAVLGEILFEVLTSPESFEAAKSYDYAEHKVVEDRPRLQWMADALEELSVDLAFHVAFTNPQTQMNALRAAASDHQARALVFGNGIHRGHYVISEIRETHRQLADDGSLFYVTVKLQLKEWVQGADFDPFAPPKPKVPPPGLVAAPAGITTPTPFNPSLPIGPHNLLPESAIVTLSSLPSSTYSPPGYPNPGVSAGVSNPIATGAPSAASDYKAVSMQAATRSAP